MSSTDRDNARPGTAGSMESAGSTESSSHSSQQRSGRHVSSPSLVGDDAVHQAAMEFARRPMSSGMHHHVQPWPPEITALMQQQQQLLASGDPAAIASVQGMQQHMMDLNALQLQAAGLIPPPYLGQQFPAGFPLEYAARQQKEFYDRLRSDSLKQQSESQHQKTSLHQFSEFSEQGRTQADRYEHQHEHRPDSKTHSKDRRKQEQQTRRRPSVDMAANKMQSTPRRAMEHDRHAREVNMPARSSVLSSVTAKTSVQCSGNNSVMDLSEYHQHRLSGLPDPTHTISADTHRETHHDPHRTHRPQQSLDLSAGHSRLSSTGSDEGRQTHEGRQGHEGHQAHESRSNSTTVRHRKPHHLDNANALSLSSQPYHMDDYVPTSKSSSHSRMKESSHDSHRYDYPPPTSTPVSTHHSPTGMPSGGASERYKSHEPRRVPVPPPMSTHATVHGSTSTCSSTSSYSDLNSVQKCSDITTPKPSMTSEPEEQKFTRWPMTKKERILGAASNRRNTELNSSKGELPSPTIPPDIVDKVSVGEKSVEKEKPSSYADQTATEDNRLSSAGGKPSSYGSKPSSYSGKPSSYSGKPSSYSGKPSSYSGKPMSSSGKPSAYGSKPSAYTGKPATLGHRTLFKHRKAWLLSQRAQSVGPYKMSVGSTTLQRTMPGFAPKMSMPLKRPSKPVRQSRKYMYPTRIYSLRSRDKDEEGEADGATSPKAGKKKQKKKIGARVKAMKSTGKPFVRQSSNDSASVNDASETSPSITDKDGAATPDTKSTDSDRVTSEDNSVDNNVDKNVDTDSNDVGERDKDTGVSETHNNNSEETSRANNRNAIAVVPPVKSSHPPKAPRDSRDPKPPRDSRDHKPSRDSRDPKPPRDSRDHKPSRDPTAQDTKVTMNEPHKDDRTTMEITDSVPRSDSPKTVDARLPVHTQARNLSSVIEQLSMSRPKLVPPKPVPPPKPLTIPSDFGLKVDLSSVERANSPLKDAKLVLERLPLSVPPSSINKANEKDSLSERIMSSILASTKRHDELMEKKVKEDQPEKDKSTGSEVKDCNSYDFLKSMLSDDGDSTDVECKGETGKTSKLSSKPTPKSTPKSSTSNKEKTPKGKEKTKSESTKSVGRKRGKGSKPQASPERIAEKKRASTNKGSSESKKASKSKQNITAEIPPITPKKAESSSKESSPMKEPLKKKAKSSKESGTSKSRSSKSPSVERRSSDKESSKSHRKKHHKSSRHSSKHRDRYGDSEDSSNSRCSTPLMTSTTTSTHNRISIKIRTVDPVNRTMHTMSVGECDREDTSQEPKTTQKKARSKKRASASAKKAEKDESRIMEELKAVKDKIDALKQEQHLISRPKVVDRDELTDVEDNVEHGATPEKDKMDENKRLESALEATSNKIFDLTRAKNAVRENVKEFENTKKASGSTVEDIQKKRSWDRLAESDNASVASDDTVVDDEPRMPKADVINKIAVDDFRDTPPQMASPAHHVKDGSSLESSDITCPSPPQLYPMEAASHPILPAAHKTISDLSSELGPPTMSPSHVDLAVPVAKNVTKNVAKKSGKKKNPPPLTIENTITSDAAALKQSTIVNKSKTGGSPKLNTSKSPRSCERALWESMTNDAESSLNTSDQAAEDNSGTPGAEPGAEGPQKKARLFQSRRESTDEFSPRHDISKSPFRAFGQNKKPVKKRKNGTGQAKKNAKGAAVPSFDDPYAFNDDEEDMFGSTSPVLKSAPVTNKGKSFFNPKIKPVKEETKPILTPVSAAIPSPNIKSEHSENSSKVDECLKDSAPIDVKPSCQSIHSPGEVEGKPKPKAKKEKGSKPLPKKKRGRPPKSKDLTVPLIESSDEKASEVGTPEMPPMICDDADPQPLDNSVKASPSPSESAPLEVKAAKLPKVSKLPKQQKMPKLVKATKALKDKPDDAPELPPEFKTRVLPTRRKRPPERLTYVPREGSEVESDEDILEQKVPFRRALPGGIPVNYIPEPVALKNGGSLNAIQQPYVPPSVPPYAPPSVPPYVPPYVPPAVSTPPSPVPVPVVPIQEQEPEEEDSVQMDDKEWLEKAANIFGRGAGNAQSRSSSVSGQTPAHSTPGIRTIDSDDDVPALESDYAPSEQDDADSDSDLDADPYLIRRNNTEGNISSEADTSGEFRKHPKLKIKIGENTPETPTLHSAGSSIRGRPPNSDHSRHSVRTPASRHEDDFDLDQSPKYLDQPTDSYLPSPVMEPHTNGQHCDISDDYDEEDDDIVNYQPQPNRRARNYIASSDSDEDYNDDTTFTKPNMIHRNSSFDSMDDSPYSQTASSEAAERSPIPVSHRRKMKRRRQSNGSIRFPDLPCVEDCCHFGHQHESLPDLLQQLQDSIDLTTGNTQDSDDATMDARKRYLFDPYTFLSQTGHYVSQGAGKVQDYLDDQVCVPSPDGFLDQVLYAGDNESPVETTMISMADIVSMPVNEMSSDSLQHHQMLAQQRADKLARKQAKKEKRRRKAGKHVPDTLCNTSDVLADIPSLCNPMDRLLTASTLDFNNPEADEMVLQHVGCNGIMNNSDSLLDSENLLVVSSMGIYQSPRLSIENWDLLGSPTKLSAMMCGDDPGGGPVGGYNNQTSQTSSDMSGANGLYTCHCGEIFSDEWSYSQHESVCVC